MFNEDWYTAEQAQFLQTLVQKVKHIDGKVIEIGCWEGKSTSYLANEAYPENVICNDTWLGNVEEGNLTGTIHPTCTILQTRDVYSIFINNMNTLTKGNYSVVKDDCIRWLSDFKEPIKLCHIDASHEYYSVKRTIDLLLPNIVTGGILCGDDFITSNIERYDLHGGVERAVRECLPDCMNEGNLWYWIKTQ